MSLGPNISGNMGQMEEAILEGELVNFPNSEPQLAITRETFDELFPNDQELYDLLVNKPDTSADLFKYYLPSKLWRLNNLYTIVDKDGNRVKFRMNAAQFKVYAAFLIHARLLILKSRQQGISTFWLIFFFDDTIFRKYLNVGLMAQGADEAATLLERIKFSWDNLSPEIIDFLGRKKTRDNTREYAFNNDSNIFIRTSFRSATLQRLHISEYGKICNESPKRAKETKTGTLQTIAAGNPVIIESTAEGHNDFKTMWDQAKALVKSGKKLAGKDFYPLFLSWLDDPTCIESVLQEDTSESIEYFTHLATLGLYPRQEQKNFWIVQYRELEGDIYQEYPATDDEAFRASRDGTFWSKKYLKKVSRRGHIRKKLFDKHLLVHAAIDSGMHDYFVMIFFQVFNKEIRIIGEFWHSNEALDYYADYIKEELPKKWKLGTFYLPHDFGVRDMSGEGLTRQEVWAEDYGITNTEILEKAGLEQGIECVRAELTNMYLDPKCEYTESCFLNYSKKWDTKLLKWTKQELHDKYSHGAAAIRYMVQAVQTELRLDDPDDWDNDDDRTQADGVAL